MNLFGYEIKRKEDKEDIPRSFAPPLNDDGAVNVESTAVGGAYGYFLDIEGTAKTESELVTRYRSMAMQPEVQQAVDEIVNEAINIDFNERAVEIVLEDVELPDKVKESVTEEFDNVLRLLDFSNIGYDIFHRFFVDGRINYHVIIDEKNLKKGIVELRYLDPRKIRLIRENDSSERDKNTGIPIRKTKKEYFMYSESGFGSSVSKPGGDMQSQTGYKIAKDSIARVTSGLMNETQSLVLSHLHRSIKPLNQLRILEDATVIYTLTRAPERRVFYVDVGNLPKAKAEQYLSDMMNRHKNKLTYNSASGEVGDSRKFMTMTEDFWFPRREGCFDLSTKIDLLDGRSVELGQLIVEHKMGKTNWTYSISPTGDIVPGKISWAGVTRNDAQVLDVHLDNGEVITATPDHKFILRTGEIIHAMDLQPGTSLMPFYTRKKGNGKTKVSKDYHQIQHNSTEKWQPTHQMVYDYFNEAPLKTEVRHHIDNNRFNNNPDNLVVAMDKQEHLLLHTKMAKYGWRDEIYDQHCENLSIAGKVFFETEAGLKRRREISEFNKQCEAVWRGLETGRAIIKANRERDRKVLSKEDYLAKWSPGFTQETAIKGSIAAKEQIKWDRENLTPEEWKAKYANRNSSTEVYNQKIARLESLKNLAAFLKPVLETNVDISNEELFDLIRQEFGSDISVSTIRKFLRANGYETLSHFICRCCGTEYASKRRIGQVEKEHRRGNHSVTKIVWRDDRMDVGTLTIDENHEHHDYHNFALSSGIFVMNSRSTEIDTLPGGASSLTDNENLTYFQRKLYKSLNVPVSRLEPDNMYSFGRVSEMTRDELRFSKFIRRLRTRFSILFDVVLEKQLILKGILTPEEFKEIKDFIRYDFMKDNYFEELKQMEILREKISTLRDVEDNVGRYFSREWVQKNVLFMNDDDIKDMKKAIDKERKAGVYKDPDELDSMGDMQFNQTDVEPTTADDPEQEENSLLINSKKLEQYKQSRRKRK